MSRAELHTGIRADFRFIPRDFVAAYQRDLVRVAFVLTGDDQRSVALARMAFIAVLVDATDDETDPQSWSRLLTALSHSFLQGIEAAVASVQAQPGESGDRQEADDERVRLRDVLDQFDSSTRAALVLHDLGGLNGRDIAALTGIAPGELDLVMEQQRERILEAAGRFSRETPQRLLASLAVDAPRSDLWTQIAPVLAEFDARRRQRTRRIFITMLVLLLALGLVSAVWFLDDVPFLGGADENASADDNVAVLPTRGPIPTQPPRPTATPAPTPTTVQLVDAALGSRLQMQAIVYDYDGNAEERLFSFDPQVGRPAPVRQASQPLTELPPSTYASLYPSPDGRWMVLSREFQEDIVETEEPDDYRQVTVLSAARDGEEQGWEYEIPASGWDSAVIGDRLFVAIEDNETPTLVALDLRTGGVIDTVKIELPDEVLEAFRADPNLFVALFSFTQADSPQLYAFVTANDVVFPARWTRVLYQIQPDALRMEMLSTVTVESDDRTAPDISDFGIGSARVLPDGSGLYEFVSARTESQPNLRFLDFESGQVDMLEIPFTPALSESTDDVTEVLTVTSNDGRSLYAISRRTNEVAIIDLTSRRAERVFPLDPGGIGIGPIDASRGLLSHDGRWLYLVEYVGDQWDRSGPYNEPPERNPIWIVDLTTWRVARRLAVSGAVDSIALDPDSEELHVISQVRNLADPEHQRFLLMSFDAQTWEMLDSTDLSDLVTQFADFSFRSASGLYRGVYGRAPAIDGVEPGVVAEYTTLPRARIAIDGDVLPVGVTVPVRVEYLDPATGEPLTQPNPRVRYDPDLPTTLVFEQGGQKSLITVSAEIAPGQQQGTIRLKAPGIWSARIIAGDDEAGFTLRVPGAFRGVSTFEGDDGNLYMPRLETDPDEPVPAGDIVVRAVFADAATGEPIAAGVDLVDGMPEEVRLVLIVNQRAEGGSLQADLLPVEHGTYEGEAEIWAGHWQASFLFRFPTPGNVTLSESPAGWLDVVDEP